MLQHPGSGTITDEVIRLKRQIAELTRRGPNIPACRVKLNSDVPLGIGDTTALGGWVVQEDPDNLFTLGGGGVFTNIAIPVTGSYMIQYHANHVGPTSGYAEAKVMRNGTTVSANTVAFDQGDYVGGGGGLPLDAIRLRIALTAGDKIYWTNYSSVAYTLTATVFGNARTEIAVVYTGP